MTVHAYSDELEQKLVADMGVIHMVNLFGGALPTAFAHAASTLYYEPPPAAPLVGAEIGVVQGPPRLIERDAAVLFGGVCALARSFPLPLLLLVSVGRVRRSEFTAQGG